VPVFTDNGIEYLRNRFLDGRYQINFGEEKKKSMFVNPSEVF